jgi:glycosyltransferase involved in cell wall biosynthesis
MKIVHLSSVHYAFDTRIFHRECSSLVKLGYDIDLIVQTERDECVNGINIIALPNAASKMDRFIKIIPALWSIAKKYPESTLFHIHDSELIVVGLLLKRKGFKVIYDVHEDVPRDLLSKVWIPKVLRKPFASLISFLEKKADKHFDGIITVTEGIRNRFSNRNNYLVKNYPDYEELNLAQDKIVDYENRENKLSYIGEIQAERGIHHIVNAVGIVAEKYPHIIFNLGGKVNDNYKKTLESLKGWENTAFLGWITRPMIPEILQASKVGLLVLDKHPNFENSKPVKLFEYMLCGLPIIASNFRYWKDLIGAADCCIFVEPSNPVAISDAIEWIFNNPLEAKQMGERGKAYAMQNFNWETELQSLMSCYSEVIKNG